MALTKCRECGADISSRAMVCPKCGNPIGTYRWLKRIIVIQIAVVALIIAMMYGLIGWLS